MLNAYLMMIVMMDYFVMVPKRAQEGNANLESIPVRMMHYSAMGRRPAMREMIYAPTAVIPALMMDYSVMGRRAVMRKPTHV